MTSHWVGADAVMAISLFKPARGCGMVCGLVSIEGDALTAAFLVFADCPLRPKFALPSLQPF